MRKILAFFWYPNLWKFEKNLKQSDRAPLSNNYPIFLWCVTYMQVDVCFVIVLAGKWNLILGIIVYFPSHLNNKLNPYG